MEQSKVPPRLESRSPRLEWLAPAALVLVAILPALVLLVRLTSSLPHETRVAGDAAIIELYTLRATGGDQLLGPYSRFGFHHPGPLVFYWLAPFYLAFGKSYAALCLGALVLNVAALVGIVLVVWRVAGPARLPWGCAVIAAFLVSLHPAVLVSAWNPDVAVLPLAFALVAFAAAMAGHTVYLPAAVGAGSLAAQSHLTAVAPAAWAVLLAAAVLIVRRRGLGLGSVAWRSRTVQVAALTGVALWVPPILEQFRNTPGNLTLITRFLQENQGRRPVGSAFLAAADALAACLLGPFGLRSEERPLPGLAPVLGVAGVALLVLLVMGTARGWRRRDLFAAASCGSAVALFAVGVLVTRGVTGRLHPYLVQWLSGVGLLGALGVVCAFVPPAPPSPRAVRLRLALCWALVLTTTALGLRDVARFPALSRAIPAAQSDVLSDVTLAALAARGIEHPHLRILSHGSWEQAAALALQCTRAGRSPTVDSAWLFMFGDPCRFRGTDDGVVLITNRAIARELAAVPGVERVGEAGDNTVLIARSDRSPIRELSLGTWPSDVYLRGGFSGPEDESEGGFRWSNGPVSWLVLPGSAGSPHRLRLVACPIEVPGMEQTLDVTVNGVRVGTVTMAAGWAPYSFAIPGGLARSRNLISFGYAFIRSPYELKEGDDKRRLAVRFRSISLSEEAR